jgi:hypothetical protein
MFVEGGAGRMVVTRFIFIIDVLIQIDLLLALFALKPRAVSATPSVIYRETVHELAESECG